MKTTKKTKAKKPKKTLADVVDARIGEAWPALVASLELYADTQRALLEHAARLEDGMRGTAILATRQIDALERIAKALEGHVADALELGRKMDDEA